MDRERSDAPPGDGPPQGELWLCSDACGARNLGRGRWNVEEEEDPGSLSYDQSAYVIGPEKGFAYFSQQREQGCEGS